ncbi:hypothetical protein B0H34DRAFT_858093 [Crassisporium funariophilum]|nr:hypothetical protein B0H34DRAFT_858093 [Crassisporium funariophilum]
MLSDKCCSPDLCDRCYIAPFQIEFSLTLVLNPSAITLEMSVKEERSTTFPVEILSLIFAFAYLDSGIQHFGIEPTNDIHSNKQDEEVSDNEREEEQQVYHDGQEDDEDDEEDDGEMDDLDSGIQHFGIEPTNDIHSNKQDEEVSDNEREEEQQVYHDGQEDDEDDEEDDGEMDELDYNWESTEHGSDEGGSEEDFDEDEEQDNEPAITSNWQANLEGLEAPTSFPYNLAWVCPLWHEVLGLTPEYWTEIVVFVDSRQPTPLSDVAAMLSWSKDQVIQLTVRRSEGTYQDHDPEEGARTRAVIDLVKPHVRRCISIVFRVIHGSSLPSVSRHLFGYTSILKKLSLKCEVDDYHPVLVDDVPLMARTKVRKLHLEGYTILDVCQHVTSLFQGVKDLIFSNYRLQESEDHAFIMKELITSMSSCRRLASLNISNLDIPYCYLTSRSLNLDVEDVKISRLNAGCIQTLLEDADLDNVESLTIESCSFDESRLHGAYNLMLINITHDLASPLRGWTGGTLTVDNCPGFSDDLINYFATVEPSLQIPPHTVFPDPECCIYPYVVFCIKDCMNFSARALKHFMEVRLAMMDTPHGPYLRVGGLRVTGEVPLISEDDYAWFEKHIPEEKRDHMIAMGRGFEWHNSLMVGTTSA